MHVNLTAQQFQDYILQEVSRTFALTIPKLPGSIRNVVANAYLLCRIIDTIEDDPELSIAAKQKFHEMFKQVVAKQESPAVFADELSAQLSAKMLPAERDLIVNTEKVIEITNSFNPEYYQLLQKCVNDMSTGMPIFERQANPEGLPNLRALDQYCYYVAGVVGEMLTGLFCQHIPSIVDKKARMLHLGVSFAQGLQMTNILKDVWDDKCRKICWLPKDLIDKLGFKAGVQYLAGVAKSHLNNAMTYTLLIPRRETGIRKFCLLAIGLAMKTLHNIYLQPGFTSGQQVKVPRSKVKSLVLQMNFMSRSNWLLENWFASANAKIPTEPLAKDWSPKEFHGVQYGADCSI